MSLRKAFGLSTARSMGGITMSAPIRAISRMMDRAPCVSTSTRSKSGSNVEMRFLSRRRPSAAWSNRVPSWLKGSFE